MVGALRGVGAPTVGVVVGQLELLDLVELVVADVDAAAHELVDELLVGLHEEALEQRVPEPRERWRVRWEAAIGH